MLRSNFKIDLRALAAFRISLALLIISDLFLRGLYLSDHYTDFGLLPRSALVEQFLQRAEFSLYLVGGSTLSAFVLFGLAFIFALGLLLGIRTRLCTILSWMLLMSIQNRNPLLLQAGDILFRLLLFWGIFLPLGARLSVDSALITEKPKSDSFFSAASVGLMVQLAIIYLMTALFKTGKEWWPDGTATYYALMLDQFVTPLGILIRPFGSLLKYLTFGVLGLEYAAFFLLLLPLGSWKIRFFSVCSLMAMHLGFGSFMYLGLFHFIVISGLLIFIPPPIWYKMERVLVRTPSGIQIYFDRECPFCRKLVSIILTFLGLKVVAKEAQSNLEVYQLMREKNSWVLTKGTNYFFGFKALTVLMAESPVWKWPAKILSLSFFAVLGEAFYKALAKNRLALAYFTKPLLKSGRPVSLYTPRAVNLFLIFSIGIMVIWNINTLPGRTRIIHPESIKTITKFLSLDQKWNMFSPRPPFEDGWYVFPGELEDGTKVSVFEGTYGEPSWEKPKDFRTIYNSQRWRKYLLNIYQKKHSKARLFFGKYLCRRWARDTQSKQKLYKFQIVFMEEKTLPNYEVAPIKKIVLWNHRCFNKPGDK